jgi:hypothetical protein
MFFYPWYPALMLAVESNDVIDLRLRKMAAGSVNSATETDLMVREKVDAAIAAGSMLCKGHTMADVIEFYRGQVASNAKRLA